MLTEINIDGLVGPSHHFGGVGVGNVASQAHHLQPSHPRQAAWEGLRKADLIRRLGVPQFVWPPPSRPRTDLLTDLGFYGPLTAQVEAALTSAPEALSAVFSGAFMWVANAATVAPAVDATDDRYHFTPSNLISSWHRDSEASERGQDLRHLFGDWEDCIFHAPLPGLVPLRDEGAANHMRLCDDSGKQGWHVFVHGGLAAGPRFYPRQGQAASEAIARLHALDPQRTFLLHQHPDAIAAGAFHNDVIATSHSNLFLHHERAFVDADAELERLERSFASHHGKPIQRIVVTEAELSLDDAVRSYFFNSQIVTPANGSGARMVMVCPEQCRAVEGAKKIVETLLADRETPIDEVHFVSLNESMGGGGGPACLRLRIPIESSRLARVNQRYRLDERLFDTLGATFDRWYPERITLSDFRESECISQLMEAGARGRPMFFVEGRDWNMIATISQDSGSHYRIAVGTFRDEAASTGEAGVTRAESLARFTRTHSLLDQSAEVSNGRNQATANEELL